MKNKMIEKSEFFEILKRTLSPRVLLLDLLALLLIFLSGVSVCFGLLSIGWTEEVVSYVAIGLTVVLIPGFVAIRKRLQQVAPLKEETCVLDSEHTQSEQKLAKQQTTIQRFTAEVEIPKKNRDEG